MMKSVDFDQRLAALIKAFRTLRGLKQLELAQVLHIERSSFSKIENGESSLTPGELKTISEALGSSIFEFMALVESDYSRDIERLSQSELRAQFKSPNMERLFKLNMKQDELRFILLRMKQFHDRDQKAEEVRMPCENISHESS